MEAVLARLPNDAESNELREKQHFLKGVLVGLAARLQGAALGRARRASAISTGSCARRSAVIMKCESARDDWPEKFAGLTARIEALKPRVAGMQTFAETALAKQQTYIQSIAVDELKAQRDRLNTYMVQARFALASMYDRASRAQRRPKATTCSGRARDDERAAARAARDRGDLAVRPHHDRHKPRDRHDQGRRGPRRRSRHVGADRRRRGAGDGVLQAVPRPRIRRRAAARGGDAPARRLAARGHGDRASSRATCRRSAASAARSRCTRSS